MLSKVLLTLMLAAGALSLECEFQVVASPSQLDVEGGLDRCESSDQYCATININNIYAKGCSKTAQKITGQGMPNIICDTAGCNPTNTLCCCKGNMCNGATSTSALMTILALPLVKLLLKN